MTTVKTCKVKTQRKINIKSIPTNVNKTYNLYIIKLNIYINFLPLLDTKANLITLRFQTGFSFNNIFFEVSISFNSLAEGIIFVTRCLHRSEGVISDPIKYIYS